MCGRAGVRKGARVGVRESGQPDKQVKFLGTETRARRSMWLEHGQQGEGSRDQDRFDSEKALGKV